MHWTLRDVVGIAAFGGALGLLIDVTILLPILLVTGVSLWWLVIPPLSLPALIIGVDAAFCIGDWAERRLPRD